MVANLKCLKNKKVFVSGNSLTLRAYNRPTNYVKELCFYATLTAKTMPKSFYEIWFLIIVLTISLVISG